MRKFVWLQCSYKSGSEKNKQTKSNQKQEVFEKSKSSRREGVLEQKFIAGKRLTLMVSHNIFDR